MMIILCLGCLAEANANEQVACIVTQQDIDQITLLHEQSLRSYLRWLDDRDKKLVYPELPSKFKSWAGREIGTSFSTIPKNNLYEDYLFDYVEFVQLAGECNFHSAVSASNKNTKKIIKLQTSVYNFEGAPGILSKPKVTF